MKTRRRRSVNKTLELLSARREQGRETKRVGSRPFSRISKDDLVGKQHWALGKLNTKDFYAMHLGPKGVTIHTLFAGPLAATILFRWAVLQNHLNGEESHVRTISEHNFIVWQTAQILKDTDHPIWCYWYFEEPIKEDTTSHYGRCVLFTLDILHTYYKVDPDAFLHSHDVRVCTLGGNVMQFEMSPLATVEHLLFKLVTDANVAEHVNELSLWDKTSNELHLADLLAEHCDTENGRPIELTVVVGEVTSIDERFDFSPDWNLYDGEDDVLHTAGGAVCLECNQLLHLDEITFWSFYDIEDSRTDTAVCCYCEEAALLPWWMFSTFECMRHKEVERIRTRALSSMLSVHDFTARFGMGTWEKW